MNRGFESCPASSIEYLLAFAILQVMSRESIEVVRAAVDAFNRGDWEAGLEYAAPDFEFDFSRSISPVHGVFKLDQIRGFLDEFFGQWEAVRFELDEIADVGEQVVTTSTNYHRGRDGLEVKVRPSAVWTVRDGSIVRLCLYQEPQEALEAVGLTEYSG